MFKLRSSTFDLACRRALFLLIFLIIYLIFGTILFWVVSHTNSHQPTRIPLSKQEKLDFERTELLNVLWAESISRSEYDWSLLANQKLDSYEKSLSDAVLTHSTSLQFVRTKRIRTFAQSFRHSFLLITTIGAIDGDSLTPFMKILSILYTFIGIPLVCLYLKQCVCAISAVLSFNESSRQFNKSYICAAFVILFAIAVGVDICEQNNEDTPFFDVIFEVFLGASTIGPMPTFGKFGGLTATIFFYATAIISIGMLRVAFNEIQRYIERQIGGYEFAFTHKIGEIERVLSENRLNNVVETDEEDSEIVDPLTIPTNAETYVYESVTNSIYYPTNGKLLDPVQESPEIEEEHATFTISTNNNS